MLTDIHDFLRAMWVSRYGDLKKVDLFAALKQHLETKHVNAGDFARGRRRESGDGRDRPMVLTTGPALTLKGYGTVSSVPCFPRPLFPPCFPLFAPVCPCSIAARGSGFFE